MPTSAPTGNTEEATATAAIAATPVARVASRDERGVARTILGSGFGTKPASPINVTSETAARLHLVRNANLLGVTEPTIRGATIAGTHEINGGGAIVQFEQRIGGIEVFRSRASVLLDAEKNLVSIANGLAPGSVVGGKAPFKLPGEAAVANAYTARSGMKLAGDAVKDMGPQGEFRSYSVDTPPGGLGILQATAKPVYYPSGGKLIPAYYVEFLARAPRSNENQGWGIVVSSLDGTSLYQRSLTQTETFNYRVWAHADKTPMDGPIVDKTPYPVQAPDKVPPNFMVQPTMVAMEGFNRTRSGADGGVAPPDPWLAPTATVTFGNNVEAYSDRNQFVDDAGITRKDGYDEGGTALDGGYDFRADLTSALTFDRVYNTAQAPNVSVNQIKAAVTQIFYTTNWLHDYWYDSGFDEAAKNAQRDNFGRGGVGGDPVRCEAQDSADSGQGNNANMSTFSDGTSPRMQMYVWNGLPNRQLTTTPTALTFADGIGASSFGPQIFDVFPTVANAPVIANDGTVPNTADACEAITNTVTNRIVIVDRGNCPFVQKAANAQAAGAVGIIIVNNAPGNAPPSPGGADPSITIPLLGVSLEEGGPLKTAVTGGQVTRIRMQRGVETQLDGTIDNTIVAHEWGHYWHLRLVMCGSQSCYGMSEGWGDFAALMMVVREGDTFGANVYPLAQYASAGLSLNAGYFGIRRAPYSADHAKNPFTFGHVRQMAMLPAGVPLSPSAPDMSEVHNVGEIWAQTLFQGYINLLAIGPMQTPARSFADSRRRMADYVTAGMKNAPPDPTFTEQRDAILRPIYMAGKTDPGKMADFLALARGFADRGLGSGAISPPPTSVNLNEAVENFDIKGSLDFDGYTLDDSLRSCDNDGVLDANERGVLKIKVSNIGWETLMGSTVTVSSTDTNLTFEGGGTATIASLEPYGQAEISVNVTAGPNLGQRTLATIKVSMVNASAVKTPVEFLPTALLNYDDKPAVSSSDDVESNTMPVWTATGPMNVPLRSWSRQGDARNHFWHGNDVGTPSDEILTSPSLTPSASVPFVMNFSHRYSFEADVAGGIYYDGGVLEISEDNGTTWKDAMSYAGIDPGYNQVIHRSTPPPPPDAGPIDGGPTEANPLAGRPGFVSESPGYPSSWLTTSLDFGSQFVGKTVKVRFRIGTDEGTGAPGWDIDNVSFGGPQFSSITNTPFGAISNNSGICGDGGTGTDAGRPDAATPDVRMDTGGGGMMDVRPPDAPTGDAPTGDAPTGDAPRGDGSTADVAADVRRDTGSNTTTTTGGGTPPADDDGCGCTVPGRSSSRGGVAAMLGALGALSVVLRRRRRITH